MGRWLKRPIFSSSETTPFFRRTTEWRPQPPAFLPSNFAGRPEVAPRAALSGAFPRTASIGVFSHPLLLLRKTSANFWKPHVFSRFLADAQIGAVGIAEAGSLHAVTCTPLVIVNRRYIAVGGYVINQDFQRFTWPFDTIYIFCIII